MSAPVNVLKVKARQLREAEEAARDAEYTASYAPTLALRSAAESGRSHYEGVANRLRNEIAGMKRGHAALARIGGAP